MLVIPLQMVVDGNELPLPVSFGKTQRKAVQCCLDSGRWAQKFLGHTKSTHVIHNVRQLMEIWIIPNCAF
jgi:hypothetical protein